MSEDHVMTGGASVSALHLRRHSLDGVVLPSSAEFTMTPAPGAARFVLRGGPEIAAAAGTAFGVALPTRPNRAEQANEGGRAALWLGPDEWLLIAPGEAPESVVAALAAALTGASHSLVDISHRQTGVVVEGPLAGRVLSAGCPLDLRAKSFPDGMATRTIFFKAEIVLWRQAAHRFHVEVWRSFAPYLAGHFAESLAGIAAPRGGAGETV